MADYWAKRWVEVTYWALSLTLVLVSETFLIARASSTLVLLSLVGTQILLCIVLWAATRRFPLFDHVSPLITCAAFLLGVVWSLTILGPASANGIFTYVRVIPAGLLFAAGNSINAYHMFDYCRLSSPSNFVPAALGGSVIAAMLNCLISYTLPGSACVICGILAIAWFFSCKACLQRVTALPSRNLPPELAGHPLALLYLCTAAIGFSSGTLPIAVFNDRNEGLVATTVLGNFQDTLTVAIFIIAALIILLLPSIRGRISILLLASISSIVASTGLLLLSIPNRLTIVISSAISLTFQLVAICSLLCVFARHAGSPGERPHRFWGIQIVVLLSTVLSTGIGMWVTRSSIGMSNVIVCFIATYFLLLFLVLFQHVAAPIERDARTKEAGEAESSEASSPIVDVENSPIALRCKEIADASRLTSREAQTLTLIAHGWTVDMAARRLGVSPSTVRTHLKHLYAKTGVHSRDELLEDLVGITGDETQHIGR